MASCFKALKIIVVGIVLCAILIAAGLYFFGRGGMGQSPEIKFVQHEIRLPSDMSPTMTGLPSLPQTSSQNLPQRPAQDLPSLPIVGH